MGVYHCFFIFVILLQYHISGSETTETCTLNDRDNGKCEPNSGIQSPTKKKSQSNNQGDSSSSVWKIPTNVLGRSQEAARQAEMGYGTRIISNLIDDPRILQQLTDHREWFTCYENTRGAQTHWYEKDNPPSSIWEYLAIQMWKDQPILQEEEFAGFEIWCNILTPEGPLTWHVDKDQILYEKSSGKELSLPLYGSVWYGYPHEFTGGYLELVNYDTDTWPNSMENPDPDDMERIAAEYNRLIVFNASKFHRVSPIHSGARVTLAVNVWKERPGMR